MNKTLIALLAVSLLFTAWVINTEEQHITQLEYDISVVTIQRDIARSAFCSDSTVK